MREHTDIFFQTVMKSGGLFSSKHISCKAIKKKNIKSQVRVVISKKVTKLAVERNRLKRQIRSVFEEVSPCSVWAVFYVKKGAREVSFKELRNEVICLINDI